jgi:hypothetical protein
MHSLNRLSFFRKLISSWVSLLILSLFALAFFLFGYFTQNNLLYGLAGVLGGTALTLAVTIITSREAVLQQNAKQANLARKDMYYVPMFNDLKQVFDRLEEARQKRLPYPQSIKGMGNEPRSFIWGNYPLPTFTNWATFQEEPLRSNFTEKACKLFDKVQESVVDYNKAVSQAKDPVIEILNPKLDKAFREWANSDDFKQWSEETKGGTIWSTAQYHRWNAYIHGYVERPISAESEAQALVWAHNVLGWVLVDDIDKASDLMQKTYQIAFQTQVTPDTSWFKTILESVWTEIQDLVCVKEVHKVAGDLFVRTIQAKDYVQDRLNYIRDMYEGGEPPL